MSRFDRYHLRTTDVEAARAFYARVFGHDRAVIWPLHEQALARGARPHWLGHLGVDDPERVAAAFVVRGASRLGPTIAMRDGGTAVLLRDPGGAVLAVATPAPADAAADVDVAWHVLNTEDAPRAAANYRELFGWELGERVDLGAHGLFQPLAWHAGAGSAGGIADIASRPGVHAHWLFFFAVDALDDAIAAARAAGGVIVASIVSPDGARLCVGDDPQGGAFGLRERRADGA